VAPVACRWIDSQLAWPPIQSRSAVYTSIAPFLHL
jgi:hypothetical protein